MTGHIIPAVFSETIGGHLFEYTVARHTVEWEGRDYVLLIDRHWRIDGEDVTNLEWMAAREAAQRS